MIPSKMIHGKDDSRGMIPVKMTLVKTVLVNDSIKDDSGKDNSGKDDSGKDNSGKDNSGKDDSDKYSENSSMKKAKTLTVKSSTTTTLKKLVSKEKYYLLVCTYKVVSGKKYYSKWSSKIRKLNVKCQAVFERLLLSISIFQTTYRRFYILCVTIQHLHDLTHKNKYIPTE